MIRLTAIGAAIGTAVLASACSMMPAMPGMSGSAPAVTSDGVLVGASNNMTLYTFDRDAAGAMKSACVAACANNWPPFMAAGDARASGDWSVITRDDGAKQWAYKGKPLYFWSKDTKPGDKAGDGFNNVWHSAKP